MSKLLWMMLSVLVALPIGVNAEIYKWKDKDGVTRYSDTPPPSNVKQLPVSGKKPVVTPPAVATPKESTAPAAPTEGAKGAAPPTVAAPAAASGSVDAKNKPAASPEADAIKRQKEAEEEKKKAEKKEAELKQKRQNCDNAKKNYASYKIGGRMRKMDNNDEPQYLGDAEIAEGLQQAQKEIDEFCE